MASITGLGKIGLPKLSENMDPADAREQLQYVLTNLDSENLAEGLRTKLQQL